jgi:hypothetical protein
MKPLLLAAVLALLCSPALAADPAAKPDPKDAKIDELNAEIAVLRTQRDGAMSQLQDTLAAAIVPQVLAREATQKAAKDEAAKAAAAKPAH